MNDKKTVQNNFGGIPARYSRYKDSRIVILPVPFDKTSSWIKGSAKGPKAIIQASKNMELYDIETGTEVYRLGIHTAREIHATSSQKMKDKVYSSVNKLLDKDKFVIVIGGEHTVSLGSISSHHEHFDQVSILHLDAHSDMRDTYERNRYSHACTMARVKEVTDRIISVGIRSMDSSELKNVNFKDIFTANDIRRSKKWVQRVVNKLSANVYVTIDLDVFDPSVMPSTGTPEPGGLGWYEITDLIENVIKSKNLIGFDVVELCPSKNVAPDFLAAKLIYKILSLKFRNEQ